MSDPALDQLIEDLTERREAMQALHGPLTDKQRGHCVTVAVNTARVTMAHLRGADDDLAQQTVEAVTFALRLHPDPDAWWSTPLGRVCAEVRARRSSPDSVRPGVAARMLGVTAGRVTALADAGRLDRHPDGGILLSSVYQRLAIT